MPATVRPAGHQVIRMQVSDKNCIGQLKAYSNTEIYLFYFYQIREIQFIAELLIT